MARVEIAFQIEENVLITALTEIRQAFGQFDPDGGAEFSAVYSLLNRIGAADRFEVEPGDEDDSDDNDEDM
jgi:hypothetical protein